MELAFGRTRLITAVYVWAVLSGRRGAEFVQAALLGLLGALPADGPSLNLIVWPPPGAGQRFLLLAELLLLTHGPAPSPLTSLGGDRSAPRTLPWTGLPWTSVRRRPLSLVFLLQVKFLSPQCVIMLLKCPPLSWPSLLLSHPPGQIPVPSEPFPSPGLCVPHASGSVVLGKDGVKRQTSVSVVS